VLVVWAELIVTVNVPEPPWVMERIPGERLVIVGGAGVTCTVLVALPPLRDTVIRLLPVLTAVTGTDTVACPAVKEMEAGTVATLVTELVAVNVPGAFGVGDSVAVNVPVAPAVIVKGSGESCVGTGF
jgi:hypothetical protein